jgi:hypothetical protein
MYIGKAFCSRARLRPSMFDTQYCFPSTSSDFSTSATIENPTVAEF